MFRVLVTTPYIKRDDAEALRLLEAAGCELHFSYYDATQPNRPVAELAAAARDAHGVLAGNDPWVRAVLEQLNDLRVISRYGAGYDRVDVEAATDLGIVVTNAPVGLDIAVAEFAVGLMIASARHIVAADRMVRQHNWQTLVGNDLSGKTVGLIGFGAIGRRVAQFLQGFSPRILAYDIMFDERAGKQWGVTRATLEQLVEESDFVTIHVSLNADTRGLLAEAELRRMKPTSFLINTSRGPVIDESALERALREHWITGAALDVFAQEPYSQGPLLELDNAILTSHIAGWSHEADRACRMMTCKNLIDVLHGTRVRYTVNPAVYDRPALRAVNDPAAKKLT